MSTKTWGNITWLLWHTLAAQINETEFINNKNILIKLVIDTCHNLPCPTCTNDAKNIINKAYINRIQTKNDFIEFLRQLHNIVNIKLNKPTLSKELLNTKYHNVNLVLVIKSFIYIYRTQYGNIKMMIHNYRKEQFIQKSNSNTK